jgi:hypothetical protein
MVDLRRLAATEKRRGSVFGPKFDNCVSRLGLMSSQAGLGRIAPIRNIYNPRCLSSLRSRLGGRLHNVQSITVEEESVIAKQFVQPR